jgi:hypothetical protein
LHGFSSYSERLFMRQLLLLLLARFLPSAPAMLLSRSRAHPCPLLRRPSKMRRLSLSMPPC